MQQSVPFHLEHIQKMIVIASGKGGVGKSTTAVNLAIALSQEGKRVGLLDADIYGPNQPHLLGGSEKPFLTDDNRFEPVMRFGLQTMSMGYLVDENDPMIWRGPMVIKALQQMLFQTAWNQLDYLLIDLPPGTGDVQLTLSQKAPINGAIIVTTPQDIALLDVQKGIEMFRKTNVPILGVIENMSSFECPHCHHETDIFGNDGAHKMSEKFDVPILGKIPLHKHIRELSDAGTPIVMQEENPIAQLYREIAKRIHPL
jgi:ATP-binding protein involved in chromosome partitioning